MHICKKCNLNIDNVLLFNKNEAKKDDVSNWKIAFIREFFSWIDNSISFHLMTEEL